jgi:hypothetical protein
MGRFDELVVTKGVIDPIPEKPRPIALFSLVQLYCVLATLDPEKVTEVLKPLQITIPLPGETVTEGVGLMMMLNVLDGPLQLLLNGVTVIIV